MRKIFILSLLMIIFNISAFSQQSGWRVVDSAKFKPLRSIYMLNENEGWAVGNEGTIIKWNGTKWILQDSMSPLLLLSVKFLDSNHGWISCEDGFIMHYDGTKWRFKYTGYTSNLYGVDFIDTTIGWTGNTIGFMYKFNGSKWNLVPSGVSTGINSFYFINENKGWAACGGGYNGAVIKYNGTNWLTEYSTTVDGALKSIFFTDSLNGWAVGKDRIMKYNGTTWSTQFSNNNTLLNSVYFSDNKNGWAVGSKGLIYHFDGVTWIKQVIPNSISPQYYGVCFTDSLHGWVVGNDISRSAIYYTETGGKVMPVVNPTVKSLDFGIIPVSQQKELNFKITGYNLTNDVTLKAPTGWQVKFGTGTYANNITVPKSADTINAMVYIRFSPTTQKLYSDTVKISTIGGITKKLIVSGSSLSGMFLTPDPIDFGSVKTNTTSEKSYKVQGHALTNDVTITAPTGFKVKTGTGSYASSIVITKTADSVNSIIYVNFTPTQVKSYSDSIKHQSGTTVKYLKLTASGVVSINDDQGQSKELYIQCYPNPFDAGTTFHYSIPEKSNVTLRLYSSNGKLVSELVNQIQQRGSYDVTFNGSMLPPGLYYYSISTETNTVRQKLMLVR